ncbi:Fe(3+)-hydroxamate ABC transporter permease FhuB [Jeongeupia naejangsanensis]|uniref:Fe(3+)-hydroxamate ABC transporter permease FhuB n=1 Tax=Jeongeupia naejangsanensis TaxID=613195 RepID=A0ABS2BPN0_9NEIS|nr:Fe(3+)-hydroxamate ABC transporter permease FhuB [Jeongeupia naejangsanensis]MBM3117587.1 Fe(3+)-hydroxamate ABC transporter permease FhuB [Jeongeupia naejangsanensis]
MKMLPRSPALPLCGLLFVLTLGLSIGWLDRQLPDTLWLSGLFDPDLADPRQLVVHYAWLPRLALCLLAGAALGLAGMLLQQVLRNPLASPTTLGATSGAQLALLLATLFAPSLLAGREWVALFGAGAALGLVYALTWRRPLSPLATIFAGLVVNLYLGAIGSALLLSNPEALKGMLVWGGGALAQDGWDGVQRLLIHLVPATLLLPLLTRPLAVLDLDEASARSLGLPLRHLRLLTLTLAVFVTACVVSVAGVIGFIGLAAPSLVRLLGVRTLGRRLFWAAALGGLLLSATDALLQFVADGGGMLLPTGAMTALLGAPLLLWLIPRLAPKKSMPGASGSGLTMRRHPRPRRLLTTLVLVLLIALPLALFVGQGSDGWRWAGGELWTIQLSWRLPRLGAAAAVGLLLGLAGTVLQRIGQNPMASPELLGVSGGTVVGLLLAGLLLPAAPLPLLLTAGVLGAVLTLALLLGINRRSGFQPERVLLSGVAITALLEPLQSLALANGDPRVQQLLTWLSGSTYHVTPTVTVALLLLAVVALGVSVLLGRWLDLLPLGQAAAGALGVDTRRAQRWLLLLVALLSAAATLVIGPVSFVGLLAPHLARLLGLVRARAQLIGAGLCGALLMLVADWVGQQLLFPQELPAGLVATLLGGAYFMWNLRRL